LAPFKELAISCGKDFVRGENLQFRAEFLKSVKSKPFFMVDSKDVVKGKCKILRMQTKIKSNSLDIGKSLYYNIKNKITGELVFAG
jgi:hypothetical protein